MNHDHLRRSASLQVSCATATRHRWPIFLRVVPLRSCAASICRMSESPFAYNVGRQHDVDLATDQTLGPPTPPARTFANAAGSTGFVGHRITHKLRQQFVGIDDGQLPGVFCPVDVDTFGLETRLECLPMCRRRHEDDALAVGEGRRGEATDRAVEELLVLIELDDMIRGPALAKSPPQGANESKPLAARSDLELRCRTLPPCDPSHCGSWQRPLQLGWPRLYDLPGRHDAGGHAEKAIAAAGNRPARRLRSWLVHRGGIAARIGRGVGVEITELLVPPRPSRSGPSSIRRAARRHGSAPADSTRSRGGPQRPCAHPFTARQPSPCRP